MTRQEIAEEKLSNLRETVESMGFEAFLVYVDDPYTELCSITAAVSERHIVDLMERLLGTVDTDTALKMISHLTIKYLQNTGIGAMIEKHLTNPTDQ